MQFYKTFLFYPKEGDLIRTHIFMKKEQSVSYRDLCSLAFQLFSSGLTNKQMIQREPTIKNYKVRQLLQPSWELVIEQMESISKGNLHGIDNDIYNQAKFHFFCTIVGEKRYIFKGINCNPYGEKQVKDFISICKHFEQEGTLQNYNQKSIVRLLKGICRTYIKEYDITQENLPKIQYFTKQEIIKARLKTPNCSTAMEPETVEPNFYDDSKSKSQKIFDLQVEAMELQMKRKEMEKLKIEQAILEQRAKVLDLEKQVYSLEQNLQKKKTQDKVEHQKYQEAKKESPIQEVAPVKRKSILKKNGKTKILASRHKIAPEAIEKPQEVSKRRESEDYLQEIYTEIDEDEDLSFGEEEEESKNNDQDFRIQGEEQDIVETGVQRKDKIKKTGKKVFPNKSLNAEKIIKQSINKSATLPSKSLVHPKQSVSSSKKEFRGSSLKKKSSKVNNSPKNRVQISQMKSKDVKGNNSQKFCWNKQEEETFLKCLKKGTLLTRAMISQVLVQKFGKKKYFQSHHLKSKRISMFKESCKIYLTHLKSRRLFPPKHIQIMEKLLKNLNLRSLFVNEFTFQLFLNQKSITNEKLISFADDLSNLKKKQQISSIKNIKQPLKLSENDGESQSKIESNSSPVLTNETVQNEQHSPKAEHELMQPESEIEEICPPSFKKKKQLFNLVIPKEIIASGKRHMAIRTMNQHLVQKAVSPEQSHELPKEATPNIMIKEQEGKVESYKEKHQEKEDNRSEQKEAEPQKTVMVKQRGEFSMSLDGINNEKQGSNSKVSQNLRYILDEHLTSLIGQNLPQT